MKRQRPRGLGAHVSHHVVGIRSHGEQAELWFRSAEAKARMGDCPGAMSGLVRALIASGRVDAHEESAFEERFTPDYEAILARVKSQRKTSTEIVLAACTRVTPAGFLPDEVEVLGPATRGALGPVRQRALPSPKKRK